MNKNDLFRTFADVNDDILERDETAEKKTCRLKWGVIAAFICLTIGAILCLQESQVETKKIGSWDEIARFSNGNLVAERLVALGGQTIDVHLSYVSGGDVSDPASWNTLSITGDYNGQDFTLDCDYGSERDKRKNPAEAYAMTQYGDVEVAIYREEKSKPFLYRAVFTLDSVTYNLSIYSNDSEDIYAYLGIVLSEPEDSRNPSGTTLTDVLGFDVCRIEMEETGPHQYMWHYYVKMDGKDVCVAEQFGYDGPEAWSRDLDMDGVSELICNCTYGDGVQSVIVYRNHDGVIEEGSISRSYYEEKIGWSHLGEIGIDSLPVEQYNPEKGVFTATNYYINGYDEPVTVELEDGLEPFEFFPFNHLP